MTDFAIAYWLLILILESVLLGKSQYFGQRKRLTILNAYLLKVYFCQLPVITAMN